jgi:hypothetical protein
MYDADEHGAAGGGQQPPEPVQIAFVPHAWFTGLEVIGQGMTPASVYTRSALT